MATGNLSQQYSMAPIPLPETPKPPQQETQDPRLDPSTHAQMPPVYYGGKAGGIAHIADKVLTGWLAGTSIANERKQKAMVSEVSGAKTGLDYIGQAYRSAVESGDQTKIKQAEGALTEAWNDYLNKAEKYAMPDQKVDPKTGKPKKEGIGQRLKEGFSGGPAPNIGVAHSTLEVLRKTDPRQMYGPSKAEQQQAELNDITMQREKMGLEADKRKEAATNQYEAALNADPAKRTPEQQKYIEFYEQRYLDRTKEQVVKDDLLDKLTRGVKLDGDQRQLAERFGLVNPSVTSTTVHTTVDSKGNPYTEIVAIGPDGKIVGQPQKIPGKDYVPPNQAQLATMMINGQVSALVRLAKKAHPEWDDQTAYQFALSSVAGGASGGADWFMKNQQADVMNRAINSVLQKHAFKHKDPNNDKAEVQGYDQVGEFARRALVSPGDDGRYYYSSKLLTQPETSQGKTWYNPSTWFNDPKGSLFRVSPDGESITPEEAGNRETQFLAELRAELKKQNPKISDSELDKLMPSPLVRGGMQPTPDAQGAPKTAGGDRNLSPPPAGAAKTFKTNKGEFKMNQQVRVGGQIMYVVGVNAQNQPIVDDRPSE